MLRCVQADAFGLVSFLGTNAGIAYRIRNIVNRSIVRELGVAHHSDNPEDFLATYNSALIVALMASVVTLLVQFVLLLILPFFSVSEGLLAAARWFIFAKGVEAAYTIALAPAFNYYLVDERMATYNFWQVAIRAANVLGALMTLAWFPLQEGAGIDAIARNLTAYGWLSSLLTMLIMTIPVVYLAIRDSRFWPRPSWVRRSEMKAISASSGWVATMDLSISGFMTAAGFYMFGYFGTLGGRIFGVAMPLTFYVRMLATGMAAGLDAVSTRIASKESTESLERLIYHTTRLNAFVVFPAITFITLFAKQVVSIWVGSKLDDPQDVPMIAHVIHALAVSAISMGISDSWINVMYGAGHIRKIAPVVLLGLVVYCLTMPLALWVLPADWDYLAPVAYSSVVMFATVLVGLAMVVARALNLTLRQVLSPLVRPLVLSLLSVPVLLPNFLWVQNWSPAALLLAAVQYGGVYVVLCWLLMLRPDERARVTRALKTRVFGRRPLTPHEQHPAS